MVGLCWHKLVSEEGYIVKIISLPGYIQLYLDKFILLVEIYHRQV
jgi:hypothetical protein